jgi:hypothetical protein
MDNKQLNEYLLIFSDGSKAITRHYRIEPVKSVYLNENVRLRDGILKYCINVELLLKL